MIIDIHTHSFPDKVAERAIESLESAYGVKALSDGTLGGLMDHMGESSVNVSVIQAVSTAARQVVSINTWIADLPVNKNILGFGTIHPEFEDYHDEIQRMKELGIKGVKFQPSFQHFYPDDERMFPVYEELIKAGLIILFHAGDEIDPAKLVRSTPERLARMLDAMQSEVDRYDYYHLRDGDDPKRTARFIMAHFGGYKMWDEVEEHLLGRDIYFDSSYVLGHMETERAIRFIQVHGSERILFGTDFPFAHQEREIHKVLDLGISQEEKENILGKNAAPMLEIN